VDVPRLYRLTARRGDEAAAEGYAVKNVLASYVHLHFGSNPEVARHLVDACRVYKENR
jgi:cobyrinic acid a,c-diamide synthase